MSEEEELIDSDDGSVADLDRDMFDDDSLTEAADADSPNMDDFYQRVVSSDEEDFVNSDDGSITDLNSIGTCRRKRN